jgi:hypothetical protein
MLDVDKIGKIEHIYIGKTYVYVFQIYTCALETNAFNYRDFWKIVDDKSLSKF